MLTQLEAEEARPGPSGSSRSARSCSPATPAWDRPPWGPRCCCNKLKKAGFEDVSVVNVAIANLDDSYDLVVTHQDLTLRARDRTPAPSTSRSATSWAAPDTTRSSTR